MNKRKSISVGLILVVVTIGLFTTKMTWSKWIINAEIRYFEKDIRFASSLFPLYVLFQKSNAIIYTKSHDGNKQFDLQSCINQKDVLMENLEKASVLTKKISIYNSETEKIKETISITLDTIDTHFPKEALAKSQNMMLFFTIDFKQVIKEMEIIKTTTDTQLKIFKTHIEKYKAHLLKKEAYISYLTGILFSLLNTNQKAEMQSFAKEKIITLAKENQDCLNLYENYECDIYINEILLMHKTNFSFVYD